MTAYHLAPARPCIGCRKPTRNGSRCAPCARQAEAQRGSAAQRGYGSRWRKIRREVLELQPFCQVPGCVRLASDVDHAIPRALGGSDDPENLQALCHAHHSQKTARQSSGWGKKP